MDFEESGVKTRSASLMLMNDNNNYDFQSESLSEKVNPSKPVKVRSKKKKIKKKSKAEAESLNLLSAEKSKRETNLKVSPAERSLRKCSPKIVNTSQSEARKIVRGKRRLVKQKAVEETSPKTKTLRSSLNNATTEAKENLDTLTKVNLQNNTWVELKYPKLELKNVLEDATNIALSTDIQQLIRGANRLSSDSTKEKPDAKKIKKRRGTYELDMTINDVNVLKAKSPDEKRTKRRTFEIEPEASYLLSAKKSARKAPEAISKPQNLFKNSSRKSENTTQIEDVSPPWETTMNADVKSASKKNDPTAKQLFKRALELSPPSNTSTPSSAAKGITLRSALKKSTTDSKNVSFNTTKSITKSTRGKVPNYAAIHKSAYERMENVAEHVERKAERARLLLSGAKVPIGIPKPSEATSKKHLQFTKNVVEKGAGDTSKPTPNLQRSARLRVASTGINVMPSTPIKKTSLGNLQKSARLRVATPGINVLPSTPIKKTSLGKTMKKSVGFKTPKELDVLATKSLCISRIQTPGIRKSPRANKSTSDMLPYTRFGFKIRDKNDKAIKKEQIKAVASKTRVGKVNNIQERRNHIKGVRSNRRFDLLMNMRQLNA